MWKDRATYVYTSAYSFSKREIKLCYVNIVNVQGFEIKFTTTTNSLNQFASDAAVVNSVS